MDQIIQYQALVVLALSMMSATMLLSLPRVFRLPSFLKVISFLVFMVDMAGGMIIYSHFALGWSEQYHDLGTIMILFGTAGTLLLFLYIHYVIVRKRVK